MNGKNHTELLKEVFDAMPSMVFIVDSDVKIKGYNRAASEFLKLEKYSIVRDRGGNLIRCIHSGKNNDKCGLSASCNDCVIRNSVKKALDGNCVARARARIEIIRDGNLSEIYALITTSPLNFEDEKMVVLVIENIGIIEELRRLIPICSVCHKIRDENDIWSRIESYFKENWDVDFTHGICPDCHKKEMDKIRKKSPSDF